MRKARQKPVFQRSTLLQWIAVIVVGISSLWVNWPDYPAGTQIKANGYETFALAESIVKKHSFSDPFWVLPTGPSAHLAPLYPAYVAAIIEIFGHGSVAVGILLGSMTFMLAAQQMLLPFLAKHLGLGFWTGVLASVGWLASGIPPTFVAENTMAGLLTVIAAFLMARSFTKEISWKFVLLWAVVWGALLLLQPVVILILFSWLVLLHFSSRISIRHKIALGLLPILLVAPWIVRNFVVFHRPVFIRDNLGKELANSNNSCASPLFAENRQTGCFASSDPNLNYEEAEKVRSWGEPEYNSVRLREAVSWIKSSPGAFLDLSTRRFAAFWFPPFSSEQSEGELSRPWILYAFTVASIPGLFLMWRKARPAAYVIGLWLLFFPWIYYFLQFLGRYRWPILWATFLAGSYVLTVLATQFVEKTSSAKSGAGRRGRKSAGNVRMS